jgi:AcrR family transcriptional regulator
VTETRETRVDRRMTGAETEKKILDGTAALLDGGATLAALSVNRIAEQSGVSRATFYLHFADKPELIRRLAQIELVEFQNATAGFLADPRAGREELAETVDGIVQLGRAHAGVLSSLIELAEHDAESREEWQRVIQAIAATMAPAMRERNPQLPEPLVLTLSEIVAWTGERAMHQMVGRDATDAQARRVIEGLTETVWRIVEPASSLPR